MKISEEHILIKKFKWADIPEPTEQDLEIEAVINEIEEDAHDE